MQALRVWDMLMLDGSEVLLRVSLAIVSLNEEARQQLDAMPVLGGGRCTTAQRNLIFHSLG